MKLVKTKAKLRKDERIIGITTYDKLIGKAYSRAANLRYGRENLKVKQAYLHSLTNIKKYQDVGVQQKGSRIDKFYETYPILKFFERFRKGVAMPRNYLFFDHRYLLKKYGMKSIEYGNWTTQEDRFNYTCAMGIAFHDLKKVLGFNEKAIGLHGLLGVAFGARGKGRALAHFESWSWMINITRYKEDPALKNIKKYGIITRRTPRILRQLTTGGVGSFAHEYGHAIDYFAGAYIDKHRTEFALSNGRSTSTAFDERLAQKNTPRGCMELLLHKIIWKDKGKHSTYYKRLERTLKRSKSKGEYWKRRNELFARIFEQYIGYKLKRKGHYNYFLSKAKYPNSVYMTDSELKRVTPYMDKLIKSIRVVINK